MGSNERMNHLTQCPFESMYDNLSFWKVILKHLQFLYSQINARIMYLKTWSVSQD